MTVRDAHATCDGCPRRAPAVVAVSSPWFDAWERIPMQHGGETHLCPRCREKQARGWLAHDVVVECARCGRNSVEDPGITQWVDVIRSDLAEPTTLCEDCHLGR